MLWLERIGNLTLMVGTVWVVLAPSMTSRVAPDGPTTAAAAAAAVVGPAAAAAAVETRATGAGWNWLGGLILLWRVCFINIVACVVLCS